MRNTGQTFHSDCFVQTEQTTRFLNERSMRKKEKRSIFFLGAGILQIPGIYLARKMGLTVHAADANSSAPGLELADVFHHIDLGDITGLTEAAVHLKDRQGLDGVLTIGTDFSLSVAHIAAACALPGISVDAALNASRKDRMRAVLQDAGLPVPRFAVLDTRTEMDAQLRYLRGLRYPLVSKPIQNMGARGVREISSFGEITEAVSESAAYSHNAVVLVEEKIIGSEYSLDSLIFNDSFHPMGIARRYIDYPPYFIERGHSFPSDLSAEQEHEMFEALRKAAEVLGITTGAAKGDIFFTDRGPVIGEIAARLSGGFMSGWTFPLHSGIHPAIGAILAALGESLPPHMAAAPLQLHPVSERGIVSVPGVIRSIHHTTSTRADSPYCFMSAQEGDTVNFPTNNVEKCGNVIWRSSPEKGEEAVAGCFLPLRMEGEKKFRELLLANFPPAYPGIMKKLQNCSMRLHGTLSAAELPIPDFILNSDEKDWNYRTIPQSLEAIRYFRPHFSWRCRNASKTDPYGTWTTAQLNFLTALLKGGFQAALYYIELEQKLTEKKISPYWKLLHWNICLSRIIADD